MRQSGHDLHFSMNHKIIVYDDYGPIYAPAIIFLHGFPFNKDIWKKQIEEFKSNYRVISYTISLSIQNEKELNTLHNHVSDLIALMDFLRIRKAALCGLLQGGIIALEGVKSFSERFSALILVDAYCDFRVLREKVLDRFWETFQFYIRKVFGFIFYRVQKKSKAVTGAWTSAETMQKSVETLLSEIIDVHSPDYYCQNLPGLNVPVLMLVGEYDQASRKRNIRQLSLRLQQAQFEVIKFAGHLPNIENSLDFNVQLESFIRRHLHQRELSEPLLQRYM